MGMMNSKEFMHKRKVDEATSNSGLSNLRYVMTEKPKWKVFKKKEIVPIPQYRPVKGCPCGNDGPCKQKVTPKGVTIHYPQKKRKFGSFGTDRRYKPPRVQKSYFSRLAWKSISSSLPFQTRIQTNMHISLPALNLNNKVNHAVRVIKSIKRPIKSMNPLTIIKKKSKKSMSKEAMFLPFMFCNSKSMNKVKVVRPKKFTTWRLDKLSFNSPFSRTITPRPFQPVVT